MTKLLLILVFFLALLGAMAGNLAGGLANTWLSDQSLSAGGDAAGHTERSVALDCLVEHTDSARACETSAEARTDAKPTHLLLKVSDLQAQLLQEQSSRLQLQRDLAELQARVTALDAALSVQAVEPVSQSGAGNSSADPAANSAASFRGNPPRRDAQSRQEALLGAGIDEQRASEIVSRQDELQLAQLELRDLAAREGWLNSDDFEQQLTDLQASSPDLREELGDERYDLYLFNAGRANRISIESIINGSAADAAGLQVGDLVISYAGQRLFSVAELQRATREGTRGEGVTLRLERNSELLDTSIQRGPLGVTLGRQRVAP